MLQNHGGTSKDPKFQILFVWILKVHTYLQHCILLYCIHKYFLFASYFSQCVRLHCIIGRVVVEWMFYYGDCHTAHSRKSMQLDEELVVKQHSLDSYVKVTKNCPINSCCNICKCSSGICFLQKPLVFSVQAR